MFIFVLNFANLFCFIFQLSKEIPGNWSTEGIDRKLSINIQQLFPGEKYNFEILTTAFNINSERFKIQARTRKFHLSVLVLFF